MRVEMQVTQQRVESYLRSAAYNILNTEEGFFAADQAVAGGDHDTWLVWLPSFIFPDRGFPRIEPALLDKIDSQLERYPNARHTVLVDSLEGISKAFLEAAADRSVKIRVPIQFFDTPFRNEESPGAASAVDTLRDEEGTLKRVPQPFSIEMPGGDTVTGSDLLANLRNDLNATGAPCIRFIVGSAGAGKTTLFRSLFTVLYRDFQSNKRRLILSPRPIPFVAEQLKSSYTIRTFALVDTFLRAVVAQPVSRETLEWMLENRCCLWLFDGLDELYSGDPEFFDYLLDLLTRPNSAAQILICARDSLLTSNDRFVQFLRSFASGSDPSVKIYHLQDWERASKRHFAWVKLEGRAPSSSEQDSKAVSGFLAAIASSDSSRTLSGLPYYCGVLLDEYSAEKPLHFKDEFSLLKEVISSMQGREIKLGVINTDLMEKNGLDEFLETVASDYCLANYAGTSTDDIRVYSEAILRKDLGEEEREEQIISLVQFPLFTAADRPGVVSFKHELLAEYLFGQHLAKVVRVNPLQAAALLSSRPMVRDSLAFRYLAKDIHDDAKVRERLISEILQGPGTERTSLLLQLWISSASGRSRLPQGVVLEGGDWTGMRFENMNLDGVSFRNGNLTDASFVRCTLRNAGFEGVQLVGTRFNRLDTDGLRGAQFGNIVHFEYIYVDARQIDDWKLMKEWIVKETGIIEESPDPCPTAFQIRGMFGKFIHDDGSGRRRDLPRHALSKGKLYREAPTPDDCILSCIKHGFLDAPDYRGRIRRASGKQYGEMVEFMTGWALGPHLKEVLDELCPIRNCPHVP
jgi:hypothetical protein